MKFMFGKCQLVIVIFSISSAPSERFNYDNSLKCLVFFSNGTEYWKHTELPTIVKTKYRTFLSDIRPDSFL